MKQRVFDYIQKKYGVSPEYPWIRDYNAVFRHADNRKWFALVMEISKDRLGFPETYPVDVLNLKTDDPFFRSRKTAGTEEGFLYSNLRISKKELF